MNRAATYKRQKIMNKARRKWLEDVSEMIANAKEQLEQIRDEEQEAYDNMPENLNMTDRASTMEENIDNLDTMVSDLEDILESFYDIQ
jgi:F0F1-type ATP synthase membrane subunit b/b'